MRIIKPLRSYCEIVGLFDFVQKESIRNILQFGVSGLFNIFSVISVITLN